MLTTMARRPSRCRHASIEEENVCLLLRRRLFLITLFSFGLVLVIIWVHDGAHEAIHIAISDE